MPEPRHTLTKKIGPLPVWAYGVAILGVLGYLWWRSRSTGSSSDQGSNATILTTGSTPEQAAYGGYPQGATPASQMISPEVADELTNIFGGIQGDIADIQAQGNTTYAGVGEGLNGVQTALETQSGKLDTLTATVANLTLSPKKPTSVLRSSPLVKHKPTPPHKAQAKPGKAKPKPPPATKSHRAGTPSRKKVKGRR